MSRHHTLGKKGEEFVVRDLEERGFEVLGQNLHSRFGEIDVLAAKDGTLHVVEVKTRTSDAFGHPVEALTRGKLVKIKKTMNELTAKGEIMRAPFQIDFAAVLWPPKEQPTLEWFWNIGMQDLI